MCSFQHELKPKAVWGFSSHLQVIYFPHSSTATSASCSWDETKYYTGFKASFLSITLISFLDSCFCLHKTVKIRNNLITGRERNLNSTSVPKDCVEQRNKSHSLKEAELAEFSNNCLEKEKALLMSSLTALTQSYKNEYIVIL